MNELLTVTAPAKLNLFLHVGARRGDGYHNIESLVAFTAYGDEIRLEQCDEFSLALSGPFGAQLPMGDDNLALKAAKLLAQEADTQGGVRIGLQKNLPVASGLGGGSADAAAVLRGLVHLWRLDVDRNALLEIAASLGADVPVCLGCATAWMEGRGERVRSLSALPHAGVLLTNPNVPVATPKVFGGLGAHRRLDKPFPETAFADVHSLVDYLLGATNDLEAPARKIAPVIAEVLQEMNALPENLLTRMSGSGATCFGVFADEEAAHVAGTALRTRHPAWWIVETTFVNGPSCFGGLGMRNPQERTSP